MVKLKQSINAKSSPKKTTNQQTKTMTSKRLRLLVGCDNSCFGEATLEGDLLHALQSVDECHSTNPSTKASC
eukprot:m.611975 g.611975  ORF g.611975 m.611975 type:complete len:72 (-) comp58143_c0_seq1:76-291(-)